MPIANRYKSDAEARHKEVITVYGGKKYPQEYKNKLCEFLGKENVKSFNTKLVDKTFNNKNSLGTSFLWKGQPNLVDKYPEELEMEIQDYFKNCFEYQMIPTITSLCLWIAVDRDTLYRKARDKSSAIYDVCQQAINTCKNFNEIGAISGEISPQIFTFLGKNYYDLHDNKELNITSIQPQNQVDNNNTIKVIQEQLALENSDE